MNTTLVRNLLVHSFLKNLMGPMFGDATQVGGRLYEMAMMAAFRTLQKAYRHLVEQCRRRGCSDF
jgi:hypothetical protein